MTKVLVKVEQETFKTEGAYVDFLSENLSSIKIIEINRTDGVIIVTYTYIGG